MHTSFLSCLRRYCQSSVAAATFIQGLKTEISVTKQESSASIQVRNHTDYKLQQNSLKLRLCFPVPQQLETLGGSEGEERGWWQKEPTTLSKLILIYFIKDAPNVII